MTALLSPSTALPFLGPGALPAASDRSRTDFADLLGIADRTLAGAGPADQARDAAERFVAKVLVEPLLGLARASNNSPPPLGPAPGEQQFGSLLDAQRAMDLVRSTRWPIVDRLARDLERSTDATA